MFWVWGKIGEECNSSFHRYHTSSNNYQLRVLDATFSIDDVVVDGFILKNNVVMVSPFYIFVPETGVELWNYLK